MPKAGKNPRLNLLSPADITFYHSRFSLKRSNQLQYATKCCILLQSPFSLTTDAIDVVGTKMNGVGLYHGKRFIPHAFLDFCRKLGSPGIIVSKPFFHILFLLNY